MPQTGSGRYLQYNYIVANDADARRDLNNAGDGSADSRIHELYHPVLRNFTARFGYYDLFLIDDETGQILYTVEKEIDLGTRLINGPYENSGLGRVFDSIQSDPRRGRVQFFDYAFYRPSSDAPAAFVASAIVDPLTGFGETGESYLVGPDFSARSEPRLLLEDPARRAFEGVTDTEVIRGYFGGDVLSSYAPLELPGLDWVIVAERSLSEAEASIDDLQRSLLIATGIIVLALTGVAVVLSSALVRPTNRLIAWAKRVREGDVSAELGVRSDDEFGQLASSFDEMLEGLRQQTATIERQNQENEALLLTMTPASIAHRLRAGEEQIADEYPNVTVIATNLVGFTKLTTRATAHTAAAILNDLVGAFDDAADRIGIEKIKTVSDSYIAVCRMSEPRLDQRRRAAEFVTEARGIVERYCRDHDPQLGLAAGISNGEVEAGVIGHTRVVFEIWVKPCQTQCGWLRRPAQVRSWLPRTFSIRFTSCTTSSRGPRSLSRTVLSPPGACLLPSRWSTSQSSLTTQPIIPRSQPTTRSREFSAG